MDKEQICNLGIVSHTTLSTFPPCSLSVPPPSMSAPPFCDIRCSKLDYADVKRRVRSNPLCPSPFSVYSPFSDHFLIYLKSDFDIVKHKVSLFL